MDIKTIKTMIQADEYEIKYGNLNEFEIEKKRLVIECLKTTYIHLLEKALDKKAA